MADCLSSKNKWAFLIIHNPFGFQKQMEDILLAYRLVTNLAGSL